MTMKRVIVGLGIAAAAGIGVRVFLSDNTKPPQIVTARVTSGRLAESVSATGTLQAVTTVQVGTQVSGIVQDLYADFNSIVKKGDVIARLDPSTMQTQVEQARANLVRSQADLERLTVALENARAKHERAKVLAEKGLLPQSELEAAGVSERSAEAQVRSAKAAITQAQASLNQQLVNLQHTVIRAPIDGLVISRNVDRGQTVAASMSAPTLFVIAADLTKMQVVANIDESDVGRIRPRQRVEFTVDAFPSDAFTGTVAQVRLQPIVEQNVTTYATVIDVPNPGLALKPGMTANVRIEIAARAEAVLVPAAALRFRPTEATYAALDLEAPPPAGIQRSTLIPSDDGEAAGSEWRADAGRRVQPSAATAVPKDVGADTVDALFGPVESPDTPGRVWVFDGSSLEAIPVRTGISNGQFTELLAGDLEPGMELVTNVVSGDQAVRSSATVPSFLSGSRPRASNTR